MPVTQEAARGKLYHWIADNLGDEEADAIMTAIPTTTWDDVLTKDHLDARLIGLRAESKAELETMRAELKDEMSTGFARVDAAMRAQLMWMIATMVAMTGVIIAAFVGLH